MARLKVETGLPVRFRGTKSVWSRPAVSTGKKMPEGGIAARDRMFRCPGIVGNRMQQFIEIS